MKNPFKCCGKPFSGLILFVFVCIFDFGFNKIFYYIFISLHRNFKVFELIFTYIHHFLASFSELFKHKSLSFVNLSLFLRDISVFWFDHFYNLAQTSKTSLEVTLHLYLESFWKTFFMHEDSFSIHFFTIWSISAFILSMIAWKALAIGWSPSEPAIFLKIDPGCLGPFVKFQNTKEVSIKTARVSRLFFCFIGLWFHP